MQQPFSSILRAVNRKPSKPLNILCADTHEAYQTNLAVTGHNFFSLSWQGFKTWNCKFRPYPFNYQPLGSGPVEAQIKDDMVFDLILSQNKFGQYQVFAQIAARFNCPFVSLEHTLPVPQWDHNTREAVRSMRGDFNVFISEYSIREWGFDPSDPTVRVVHHGINTDQFNGWEGGDGHVLTVVNQYPQRDWCCGWNLYHEIVKGLPVNPWGDSPGFSKGADGEDHLVSLYRNASVFLNTSLISPVPTAMLEAMSVGCPIVTTATCMMPEIIEDGVNGYISNDPAVLRMRLEQLLADPVQARQIGEAGRQTIIEKFSLQQFVDSWSRVFNEAAGAPAGTWR